MDWPKVNTWRYNYKTKEKILFNIKEKKKKYFKIKMEIKGNGFERGGCEKWSIIFLKIKKILKHKNKKIY